MFFSSMMMRSLSQVDGVDEGNIVLRDGNRLYVAAGNELRVADITDTSNPTLLDTISFDDPISELYSYKGRTTVITDSSGPNQAGWNVGWLPADTAAPPNFDNPEVGVHVLELTDANGFELVYSTQLDGDYHDSRFIDGTLYVVADHETQLEFGNLGTVTAGDIEFYESVSEFVARNRSDALSFGEYQTTSVDGTVMGQLFQFDDLTASELTVDGVSSVATFDTTGQNGSPIDADAVSLLLDVEIYASMNSLYLLSRAIPTDDGLSDPSMDAAGTQIQRLDFLDDGAGVDRVATGQVPGLITDQFSADEHDGYFRIATTAGGQVVSLFVLEQNQDELDIVGSVEDIAPNERIFATRFDGDRAFVTTFRQVDPMFVIDLSDPTTPTIDGELKIPSYSNYLEVINEDYVIGIGRDTRDGMFTGLQVSLFNVSDASDPQLVTKYVFEGGRDTWSSVASAWDLLDYQAVTFDAESGILAIPTHTSFQWGGGSSLGGNEAISVLQINLESESIELVGDVDFDDRVNRSIQADGLLFGVSDNDLRIVNVLSPSETVASLDLTTGTATPVGDLPLHIASTAPLSSQPTDVDRDGSTTLMDAQMLVNMVLEHGFSEMTAEMDASCDVNRDGHFSPLDFLAVVNQLMDGRTIEEWTAQFEASEPTVTAATATSNVEMGPLQVTSTLGDQPIEPEELQSIVEDSPSLATTNVNLASVQLSMTVDSDDLRRHLSPIASFEQESTENREAAEPTVNSQPLTLRSDSIHRRDSADEELAAVRAIDLIFSQLATAEFSRLG